MIAANPDHKPNTAKLLPLDKYDHVLVSYSGGKDSLACLLHLLELGVSREKVELWHQDVDGGEEEGLMDWPCTPAYVQATGDALGIPVLFQWRVGGFEKEMNRENAPTAPVVYQRLDGTFVELPSVRSKNNTRLKFPQVSADLSVRWCSAALKIDVAARAINNDQRFLGKKILFVTGERRQESEARSKYAEIEQHRCHAKKRHTTQYRAIIDWTEQEVWNIIERWRVNPHPAYRLGFSRVSCMACIFGNPDQWAAVRQLSPRRFYRIANYEKKFDSTIQRNESVVEQANRGKSFVGGATEKLLIEAMTDIFSAKDFFLPEGQEWTLPKGAFKRCGGPT